MKCDQKVFRLNFKIFKNLNQDLSIAWQLLIVIVLRLSSANF